MRERRARILVVGPLGGATGGVAMFTETLLASGLRERFELLHLDTTRSSSSAGKAATLAPVNALLFFRQALRLLGLLARRRPELLHQPVTSGLSFWKESAFMALAGLFGARVIAHLHGARFRDFFSASGPLGRGLIRANLRRARRVVVLSAGWRDYLLAEVDPRLRTEVVANPIEHDFAEWAKGFERDYGRDPCTVLFVGRLALIKGILDAFAAVPLVLAEAPGTRFLFAGPPPADRERTRIEAARALLPAGGGAEFPGIVSGKAKRDCFARADCLILPSSHENLPITVLEAMACGLPLVVTPVGALPEFLADGEQALLVDPGDSQALAGTVLSLARDAALRRRLGEAARRLYRERFETERILAEIERVYREALA